MERIARSLSLSLYVFFSFSLSFSSKAKSKRHVSLPLIRLNLPLLLFVLSLNELETATTRCHGSHVHLGVDRAWTALEYVWMLTFLFSFDINSKYACDRSKYKRNREREGERLWEKNSSTLCIKGWNVMHVKSGETQMYLKWTKSPCTSTNYSYENKTTLRLIHRYNHSNNKRWTGRTTKSLIRITTMNVLKMSESSRKSENERENELKKNNKRNAKKYMWNTNNLFI